MALPVRVGCLWIVHIPQLALPGQTWPPSLAVAAGLPSEVSRAHAAALHVASYGGSFYVCDNGVHDGSTVLTGVYSGVGFAYGTFDAASGVWTGTWLEAGAPPAGDPHNGPFELTIADDGQSFTGWYKYAGDDEQLPWEGALQSSARPDDAECLAGQPPAGASIEGVWSGADDATTRGSACITEHSLSLTWEDASGAVASFVSGKCFLDDTVCLVDYSTSAVNPDWGITLIRLNGADSVRMLSWSRTLLVDVDGTAVDESVNSGATRSADDASTVRDGDLPWLCRAGQELEAVAAPLRAERAHLGQATCVFEATSTWNSDGTSTDGIPFSGMATFTELPTGGVQVQVSLRGMTASSATMHVHTWGDLRGTDGQSVGGHFVGLGCDACRASGNPTTENEVGLLNDGQPLVDEGSGAFSADYVDPIIKLRGRNSIIGRSLVVHGIAGDSGARAGQCVIGRTDAAPNVAPPVQPSMAAAVGVARPVGAEGASTVRGEVEFAPSGSSINGVDVSFNLVGLPEGPHGFHIHETGNVSDSLRASAAAGHFIGLVCANEDCRPDGVLQEVGNLFDGAGVTADEFGNSQGTNTDSLSSLAGSSSSNIVGRAFVLHGDGLGTENSSATRVGQGVVGLLRPASSWTGVWSDPPDYEGYGGSMFVCESANGDLTVTGTYSSVGVIVGVVSEDSPDVLVGTWYEAGVGDNNGPFELTLDESGEFFTGWYKYAGDDEEHFWRGDRLASIRPDDAECFAGAPVGEQISLAGTWDANGMTVAACAAEGGAVNPTALHSASLDDSGAVVSYFDAPDCFENGRICLGNFFGAGPNPVWGISLMFLASNDTAYTLSWKRKVIDDVDASDVNVRRRTAMLQTLSRAAASADAGTCLQGVDLQDLAKDLAVSESQRGTAKCVFEATDNNADSTLSGVATFTESADGSSIHVVLEVTGLAGSVHKMHVHEWGDIRGSDGTSVGGHFVGVGCTECRPAATGNAISEIGALNDDRPLVEAGGGVVTADFSDPYIKLRGPNSVIGRSLIIHGVEGDSGVRAAQCVIGRVEADADAPMMQTDAHEAVCVMRAVTSGSPASTVEGETLVVQYVDSNEFLYEFTGLSPGQHLFDVHVTGDVSDQATASAVGDVFRGKECADNNCRAAGISQVGSLWGGTGVTAGDDGRVQDESGDDLATLHGASTSNVLGRSMILHGDGTDSNRRMAQCVIGRANPEIPQDCVVSAWSEWTECDVTLSRCQSGPQYRSRRVIWRPVAGGQACPSAADLSETQLCYTECTCSLAQWSAWTECSPECGEGEQSRTRAILLDAPDCPAEDERSQERYCSHGPCQVPAGGDTDYVTVTVSLSGISQDDFTRADVVSSFKQAAASAMTTAPEDIVIEHVAPDGDSGVQVTFRVTSDTMSLDDLAEQAHVAFSDSSADFEAEFASLSQFSDVHASLLTVTGGDAYADEGGLGAGVVVVLVVLLLAAVTAGGYFALKKLGVFNSDAGFFGKGNEAEQMDTVNPLEGHAVEVEMK